MSEHETSGHPTASVPSTRPPGRAGHLSEPEKQAIRFAYLESGGTITFKALGAKFGVNRETAAACCKGPEFNALQKQIEGEMRATAVAKLKALTLPAVHAWGDAIPIAAKKGDHRPARELLQHVGIVEQKPEGQGMLVLVQTQVNGVPAMTDGKGAFYYVDPANPTEWIDERGEPPKADTILWLGGITPHGLGLEYGPGVEPPKDSNPEVLVAADRSGGK